VAPCHQGYPTQMAEPSRPDLPSSWVEVVELPRAEGPEQVKVWVGTWNVGYQRPFTLEADQHFLQHWMPPGMDVYVIGVQEGVDDESWFTAVQAYLSTVKAGGYQQLPIDPYRILGRGDGAFLHDKYTEIGVWAAADLITAGDVQVITSGTLSLEVLGSKGAVAVVLRLLHQSVTFVSCHLPANSHDERLTALRAVDECLGRDGLGFPASPGAFLLGDVSHHAVWLGDFNFRLKVGAPPAEEGINLLKAGRVKEYATLFDEWGFLQSQGYFEGWQEPVMSEHFFPTYKKIAGREFPADGSFSPSEYKFVHNEPWYKGGGTTAKPPAFCDRILHRSMDGVGLLAPVPGTYTTCRPTGVPALAVSDHDAVSCQFVLGRTSGGRDVRPVVHVPVVGSGLVAHMPLRPQVVASGIVAIGRSDGCQKLEDADLHVLFPLLFEAPEQSVQVWHADSPESVVVFSSLHQPLDSLHVCMKLVVADKVATAVFSLPMRDLWALPYCDYEVELRTDPVVAKSKKKNRRRSSAGVPAPAATAGEETVRFEGADDPPLKRSTTAPAPADPGVAPSGLFELAFRLKLVWVMGEADGKPLSLSSKELMPHVELREAGAGPGCSGRLRRVSGPGCETRRTLPNGACVLDISDFLAADTSHT